MVYYRILNMVPWLYTGPQAIYKLSIKSCYPDGFYGKLYSFKGHGIGLVTMEKFLTLLNVNYYNFHYYYSNRKIITKLTFNFGNML